MCFCPKVLLGSYVKRTGESSLLLIQWITDWLKIGMGCIIYGGICFLPQNWIAKLKTILFLKFFCFEIGLFPYNRFWSLNLPSTPPPRGRLWVRYSLRSLTVQPYTSEFRLGFLSIEFVLVNFVFFRVPCLCLLQGGLQELWWTLETPYPSYLSMRGMKSTRLYPGLIWEVRTAPSISPTF